MRTGFPQIREAPLWFKRANRLDPAASPFKKLHTHRIGRLSVRSPNHPSVLSRIPSVFWKDKGAVAGRHGKQKHLPECVGKTGSQIRRKHGGSHQRLVAAQLGKLNYPPFVPLETDGDTRKILPRPRPCGGLEAPPVQGESTPLAPPKGNQLGSVPKAARKHRCLSVCHRRVNGRSQKLCFQPDPPRQLLLRPRPEGGAKQQRHNSEGLPTPHAG